MSKMEETVVVPGGSRSLDTTYYPGTVHPRGFEFSSSFRLYPFPTFVFAGQRWRLEKRVALVYGENTVVVTYRMLPVSKPGLGRGTAGGRAAAAPAAPPGSGPAPDWGGGNDGAGPYETIKLRVRPLFAFRGLHELGKRNEDIQRSFGSRSVGERGSVVRCTPYPDWQPVYLVCDEAHFVEGPDWYKRVEYPQDRYRGLEFSEDLWSYGYYEAELSMGESLGVTCTLQPPETQAPPWSEEREVIRLAQIMARAPDETSFARRLVLAADYFVVLREREVPAIVAGYPYYDDHVRDTLLALPGLLLVTGRPREAKAILRAYARALERGLLPKRFPDGTRPEYGSVDATLWFFVAVFKYLQYTGDFDFVRTELRIPLLEVMRYFYEGTRFGVRIDRDGLLQCGEPGIGLTWMDARVGDQPVTRRDGKAVELNALWYNALKVMERLAERFSIPNDMARFARRAEQVELSFLSTFWNPEQGCLHDVATPTGVETAVRPNQILAVSLPFPLLDSESAESVVRVVGAKLLTPLGLRSLDPEHPAYQGAVDGDEAQRARAQHQGTSWTWLLGPYISALVKCRGESGRAEAARLLDPVQRHLLDDCLGQVSEMSWGQQPHWPRGCPASAAAVGELLRAYYEDILGRNPGVKSPFMLPPLRRR
jgi:predicted glycogen debranching enzyme